MTTASMWRRAALLALIFTIPPLVAEEKPPRIKAKEPSAVTVRDVKSPVALAPREEKHESWLRKIPQQMTHGLNQVAKGVTWLVGESVGKDQVTDPQHNKDSEEKTEPNR